MDKTPYIYILGASHSGSTLLTMLLNAHPSVATVGELAPGGISDTDNYYCSCGIPIKDCGFWNRIHQQARSKGIKFDFDDFGTRFRIPDSTVGDGLLRPLHRGRLLETIRDAGLACLTSWPRKLREVQFANTTLTELIMRYFDAQVFVDKGNIALRLKYLLQIPSYEIRTIQIVRDGRAVSLTYTDASEYADASDARRRGGGGGRATQEEKLSFDRAAYQWRRCNEEIECVLATRSAPLNLQIKYEDLCSQTQETLERIYSFIRINPDLAIEDFRSIEHHIVGNGMRLDHDSEIRIDERWRSTLDKHQLATFERIAGAMNRRFGYK